MKKFYLFDDYLYDFSNKYISPKLCFLTPDHVSLIRIIPILFIYKSIIEKKKPILFVSMIISVILDIYDGSIARECKKTSKFGSDLDLFMDMIHHVLIYYYMIILYFPNIKYKTPIIISIALIWYISSKYIFILDDKHDSKNFGFIYDTISQNTILKNFIEYFIIQRKL